MRAFRLLDSAWLYPDDAGHHRTEPRRDWFRTILFRCRQGGVDPDQGFAVAGEQPIAPHDGHTDGAVMATFLKWAGIAAIGLVLVLAAAQLIQPKRTNPATDPGRTIQARLGAGSPVVAILGRACGDCHSNATTWPGYARVAPLSWIMAAAVTEGRTALNFSDWGAYSPERQRQLLAQSCRDARSGKMPGDAWTTLHPEARLSVRDIETICAAARGP